MDTTQEPSSFLQGTMGWLSPEGKFYPCDMNPNGYDSFFHWKKAVELVNHFYPGQVGEDDYGTDGGPQAFLRDKGFIRLDVNNLWAKYKPTQAQLDTLLDLYRLKYHRDFPKESVRLLLAWSGMKFLAAPGDDYDRFEYGFDEIDA